MSILNRALNKAGYSRSSTAGVTHAQVLLSYYAAHVLEDIANNGHAAKWTINHVKKFYRHAEKNNIIAAMENPTSYFKSSRDMVNKMSKFINRNNPPVGWLFWSSTPFPVTMEEAIEETGKYLTKIYKVYARGGSLPDFSIMKFFQYYNPGFDYESTVSASDLKFYIRQYKNAMYGGGKIDAFTPLCMHYLDEYFNSYYKKV